MRFFSKSKLKFPITRWPISPVHCLRKGAPRRDDIREFRLPAYACRSHLQEAFRLGTIVSNFFCCALKWIHHLFRHLLRQSGLLSASPHNGPRTSTHQGGTRCVSHGWRRLQEGWNRQDALSLFSSGLISRFLLSGNTKKIQFRLGLMKWWFIKEKKWSLVVFFTIYA